VRDLAQELRGLMGFELRGGTAHAYQKSHYASAALFAVSATTAMAQAPAQQPMFATTKVDGTDNVYIFRYQNHQAMFVVTPAGVIVTDRSVMAVHRRQNLSGRDPQDHPGADQVSDLQPSSL